MKEIVCISDIYSPEWELYFTKQGITKPVKDKIYTIRDFVNFLHGEKGILLNEIVNKPTPRISPSTNMAGESEQAWAITRFTDLLGNPLSVEEIKKAIKPKNKVLIGNEEEEMGIEYLNL